MSLCKNAMWFYLKSQPYYGFLLCFFTNYAHWWHLYGFNLGRSVVSGGEIWLPRIRNENMVVWLLLRHDSVVRSSSGHLWQALSCPSDSWVRVPEWNFTFRRLQLTALSFVFCIPALSHPGLFFWFWKFQ